MRSASSSSPRSYRMSAIWPIVRARVHIAQALIDRQLFLAPDAKRLVQLAAAVQNVGNLAHRHGARAHIAQALERRGYFVAEYAKRLVQLAAGEQNVGDPAHRHGARAHLA